MHSLHSPCDVLCLIFVQKNKISSRKNNIFFQTKKQTSFSNKETCILKQWKFSSRRNRIFSWLHTPPRPHLAFSVHSTLQHTATHSSTPQHIARHTASQCITLQHTASHCNTLHHTATHCNILLCTVMRTHSNRMRCSSAAEHCKKLHHTA